MTNKADNRLVAIFGVAIMSWGAAVPAQDGAGTAAQANITRWRT